MSDIVFGLMLTLIGMGIVLLTLVTLQMVIMLLGAADRWASRRPVTVPAAPPAAAAADAIPADVVAAIAAAVTVALREPVRIHHIHIHQDETQAAWSRIGRLDIMRSHSTGSAKF
ncbi:MAG TPA: OadG family protein [Acidobacteriota bacterium]|nr:OadG family protein [Acidobacteriota bacterium]HQG93027.1 OadG family protein [Acidobacteriota bacterium]HQK86318.1 OadG family protein [Acidobacteriota bacterium]